MMSYPYEPKQPTIEIGHTQLNMFSLIWNLSHQSSDAEKSRTNNKQIAARSLAGIVNTDRNEVQSDNNLLKIVGDLLTIKDNNGKRRMNLGNIGDVFAFEIYDKTGKKCTVYIDENGDAVFAGSIDTGEDCRIQGELCVGMYGSNTKGISFYGDTYQSGQQSEIYARITPYVANNEDFKGINVIGGELCVKDKLVATERDIDYLQQQIDILKKRLDVMS